MSTETEDLKSKIKAMEIGNSLRISDWLILKFQEMFSWDTETDEPLYEYNLYESFDNSEDAKLLIIAFRVEDWGEYIGETNESITIDRELWAIVDIILKALNEAIT